MFWVLALVLCVATLAVLLAVKAPARLVEGNASLAIYKDQLTELDRDLASGVIGPEEAEAQRTEISRRLLAASREINATTTSTYFPKSAVLAVPLLAAALYGFVGNYGLPDVPRAERLAAAETANDWEALIARVEQQLEQRPDDVEGWKLLVPNYLNMRLYNDAARAISNIIRINGPDPELYAAMGEALVYDNKGLHTAQSVEIFKEALKLDPKHPKARFYNALGLSQEGKTAEARVALQDLLAQSPADAPWRNTVEQELAKLTPSAAAPKISAEQVQGGEALSPTDREAMIRTMVDGLDEKLKANPSDIEGWLRLIRARTVLKETEKAEASLAVARATFATHAENKKLLDDLAKELSLK